MEPVYKIEVNLYPSNEKNDSKPYFWCIKSNTGLNWCVSTAGWEATPQAAWAAAYSYASKYNKTK